MISDTGELAWRHADKQQGLVTVDTPRTQALIGFVREDPRPLMNLPQEVENDFCAILCSSLDDLPIKDSSRMLLVATSKVENSDMAWQADGQVVAEWGRLPMAIEPVAGTVTLANLRGAKQVVARPLSALGVPQESVIAATWSTSGWSFPVGGSDVTTWYVVDVARSDP